MYTWEQLSFVFSNSHISEYLTTQSEFVTTGCYLNILNTFIPDFCYLQVKIINPLILLQVYHISPFKLELYNTKLYDFIHVLFLFLYLHGYSDTNYGCILSYFSWISYQISSVPILDALGLFGKCSYCILLTIQGHSKYRTNNKCGRNPMISKQKCIWKYFVNTKVSGYLITSPVGKDSASPFWLWYLQILTYPDG